MIDYNSFVVPDWYINNILKMRRNAYINKYYNTNGTFPSEEKILAIVISEDEKEDIKRCYYMLHLAEEVTKNNSSDIPTVEPPQDEIIEIKVGDKLPSFSVTMNKGGDVSDESLQGNVSIIMFLHTSCPSCQKLLPTIQRLYDNYRFFLGVNFALITREEGDDSISNYWYEKGLTIPYSPQSDRSIYNLFASTRIPLVYIADKEGIVQHIYTDSPDVPTYEVLENAILPLINYEANAYTISGHWVNNNDETHTITLVRDRTYTMTKDNNTYTGSYYLYVDDNGEPIILGSHDHNSSDWEHRYFIQDFNYHSNFMKWVATDNPEVVYEFVRQQ